MIDRVVIDAGTSADEARTAVAAWVESAVPQSWQDAALAGGPARVRQARSAEEYEAW